MVKTRIKKHGDFFHVSGYGGDVSVMDKSEARRIGAAKTRLAKKKGLFG